MTPALPLPMFPLGTLLFPFTPLPLHIFEPRYRALVRDCVRGDGRFGVVLIRRGSEVGGGDERYAVGTRARIADAVELDDGRWDLVVVGEERILVRTWLPDDPYPLALVEALPADREPEGEDQTAFSTALVRAERAVRRALAFVSELTVSSDGPGVSPMVELDPDPVHRAFQLAAVAPIATLDRQALLEQDDPTIRLHDLALAAEEAGEVFAQRLAAG